jgi:cytochrome b subunit of formate dehydrogenase
MELFQWGTDPWGQEILIRLSWDLLTLTAVAAVVFIVTHAVWARWWLKKPAPSADAGADQLAASVPQRVPRHSLAARVFHWAMAASALVLLFTGFLPIVGIQFAWVTIHWIAGLVLTVAIVYHVIHASFWLDFWAIWIYPSELKDTWLRVQRFLGRSAAAPRKHDKYPVDHKLYHLGIMLAGFGVIATGLVMMFRVSIPLWTRNPYLFGDQTWGVIYMLHGLASVGLVGMVVAHIYFAARPDKWWITRSMVWGWVDRGHYVEHHDPQRWVVSQETRKE